MNAFKKPFDHALYQELVRQAFPCAHPKREIRRRTDARGRITLREQCPDCGRGVSYILPHSPVAGRALDSIPFWDIPAEVTHREAYESFCTAVSRAINTDRSRHWWQQYSDYLQTPQWRDLSRHTIHAAGGICSYCHDAPAAQAHHTSYDRVGHESLEDLRAVCLTCHAMMHPIRSSATPTRS